MSVREFTHTEDVKGKYQNFRALVKRIISTFWKGLISEAHYCTLQGDGIGALPPSPSQVRQAPQAWLGELSMC